MGPFLRGVTAATILSMAVAGRASAADADPAAAEAMTGYRPMPITYDDWGGAGLMQVPSGRMRPDGDMAIVGSAVWPYDRYTLAVQALPWLMFAYRYTDIMNVAYGPASWSGNQNYKDKSGDLKFRLMREGPYTPDLSLTLRDDLTGTSLFSSEYLTATRRYYNFDITAGLAWGNGAGNGTFGNPFSLLSSHFAHRAGDASSIPGAFSLPEFTGPRVALVGGVQYATPIDGLVLKVEHDGNNFQNEIFGDNQPVSLPFNFEVNYSLWDALDLSVGYERGNTLMVKAALHTNMNTAMGLPHKDPPPPPMPRPAVAAAAPMAADPAPAIPEVAATTPQLDDIVQRGKSLGLAVTSVSSAGSRLRVTVDGAGGLPDLGAAAELALAADRADPGQRPTVEVEAVAAGRTAGTATFAAADLARGQAITGRAIDGVANGGWRLASGVRAVAQRTMSPAHPVVRPVPKPPVDGPVSSKVVKATAQRLFKNLAKYNLRGRKFAMTKLTATLEFENTGYRESAVALGRAAEIMANTVPATVEQFDLRLNEDGLAGSSTTLMRGDIERMRKGQGSPEEVFQHLQVADTPMVDPPGTVQNHKLYPWFDWGIAPHMREDMGGPTNFFMYQLYAGLDGTMYLNDNWSFGTGIGRNIYNNFNNFNTPAESNLPHVRSDIRFYLEDAQTWIDHLYANYQTRLAPGLYAKVTGGVFEWMYDGVAGEVLYYPTNSRVALGYEMTHVYQRDYSGAFRLRDYQVTTGHATLYYKWPIYGLTSSLAVGRYLAGDYGATVTLGRQFDDGITMSVFATKTNVSAAQFGEGSFDKGIAISIPFDMFSGGDTRTWGSTEYRPLTRDGGQRVFVPDPLYPAVDAANAGNIHQGWNEFGR